jgi:muconolactone delta-isomerase
MRFMVETTFRDAPTPEALALIPAEIEHGKRLDAAGKREALLVSGSQTKAWQVFRAESQAQVERIVSTFPLYRFFAVTITELREEGS